MNIQKLKIIKRLTAQETFVIKIAEIENMLTRIGKANDNHYNVNTNEVHWGNVGDITGTAEDLQAITNSLFKEGEYAE